MALPEGYHLVGRTVVRDSPKFRMKGGTRTKKRYLRQLRKRSSSA